MNLSFPRSACFPPQNLLQVNEKEVSKEDWQVCLGTEDSLARASKANDKGTQSSISLPRLMWVWNNYSLSNR